MNKLITLFILVIIASGCSGGSTAVIPPIVIQPDPINMTARELYYGYDSSAMVIPARDNVTTDATWISGGDAVTSGTTYILPVPTVEGVPNAELIQATYSLNSEWMLWDGKTSISLTHDTTYKLSDIKFYKLRIDYAKLPDYSVVLHCYWVITDVDGHPFTFHRYYRLVR